MDSSGGLAADRRCFLRALAALMLVAGSRPLFKVSSAEAALPLQPGEPFTFDLLKERARRLAAAPYVPPRVAHQDVLQTIDFESYQTISFKPEMTLWPAPSAFPVRLFHLGRYFQEPVRIRVVEEGVAREIRYDRNIFRYADPNLAARLPDDLGFAGFRFMEPSGKADWLSFLGASYFRADGAEGQYGLSARGLAIDSGLPTPEEFPRFSEFWLHRPAADAHAVVIDSLLESASCTGVYRFTVSRPGPVIMDVEANLFMRRPVTRLGIAPLTSMFWYGEANRHGATDWRPEVHDSDGLALWTGKGERIWRPLNNPDIVRTSSFVDENPKGFGLLQRDRDFEDYEDDGAFYEKRPSVWVEPLTSWGAGEVQLVELPTDDEIHDNIVAYWKPARAIAPGDEITLSYRLHWVSQEPFPPVVGRAVATRIGRGGIPGQPRPPGKMKFVIDFEGGVLDGLEQRYDLEPVITASRGSIEGAYVIKVVGTERWRVVFDLGAEGKEPVELRCYVRLNSRVLTETWLYQYLPFEFPS
jgi:glucans biosynthesis protein